MAERVEARSIRDIFASARAAKRPVVSLEFFPPKDENGEHTLLEKTIPALRQLQPDFCSVTCGAGGNTSAYSRTLQIVDRIQREHQVTAMAHLTCVNRTLDLVADILKEARELGIRNILALRGDPPKGDTEPVAQGSGFDYSTSWSGSSATRNHFQSASPASLKDIPRASRDERRTGSGCRRRSTAEPTS